MKEELEEFFESAKQSPLALLKLLLDLVPMLNELDARTLLGLDLCFSVSTFIKPKFEELVFFLQTAALALFTEEFLR